MTNLMTNINFETYIERMENVSDKDMLLKLVPNKAKVLDYGCGGGILAKNFSPYFYVGYDLERNMVNRARQDNPGYYFTHTLQEIDNIDTVIYSSVLHEVYSYNNNSKEKVVDSLREGASIINSGGCLIIRDGIMGDGFDTMKVHIRLRNPGDAQDFLKILNDGPQDFSKVEIRNGYLIGTLEDAVNFLNVYTWGWDSITRETNERVNFATLEQWHKIFQESGLKIVEEESICQESYFEHLDKIIDVNNIPFKWNTKVLFKLQTI